MHSCCGDSCTKTIYHVYSGIPAHTNPTTTTLNLESSTLPNSLQSFYKAHKYRDPSYGGWCHLVSPAHKITHRRDKLHNSSTSAVSHALQGGFSDKTAICVLRPSTECDSPLIMAAIFHCRTTTITLRVECSFKAPPTLCGPMVATSTLS